MAGTFLRRRMNTAAAPIPNSTIIGGSGTSVPEVVLELPELELVEELVELEVELEVLVEVDELVDVLVELLVELEVLDVISPEVELVLVTLPELVEVELPPVEVDVELPPEEVEVELPVLELSISMSISMPLVDTPDDVVVVVVVVVLPEVPEVEFCCGVPDVEVVVETETVPPPLLPPPKNPPKKPPPKPPPPLDPPITTGGGLPVATTAACGRGAMGMGAIGGASITRSIGGSSGGGASATTTGRGGVALTCLMGRSTGTDLPDL